MTSVIDDGLTSNEKNNEHFSSTIFISLERPNISQICSICKGVEKVDSSFIIATNFTTIYKYNIRYIYFVFNMYASLVNLQSDGVRTA